MSAFRSNSRVEDLVTFSSQVCVDAINRDRRAQNEIYMSSNCNRALNLAFEDIVRGLQPSREDLIKRRNFINRINGYISNCIEGAHLVPFGSYEMEMTTSNGDLDLSLEVSNANMRTLSSITRDEKISILRALNNVLHNMRRDGLVRNIQSIYRTAVPVVKFVDAETGIHCDVSIMNRDGIFKSRLLKLISKLDPRFRPLCYLVKAWARHAGINDPRNGTLNSMSLTLLVAFHLQTRNPPILPPFHVILNEAPGISADFPRMISYDIDRLYASCKFRIERMASISTSKDNKSSLAQLFVSFILQLADLNDLWSDGLCASTYHGKWVKKIEFSDEKHEASMAVEDFLLRGQNCARTIRPPERNLISDEMLYAKDVIAQLPSDDFDDIKYTCIKLFGPNLAGKVRPKPVHHIPNSVQRQNQIRSDSSLPIPGGIYMVNENRYQYNSGEVPMSNGRNGGSPYTPGNNIYSL